jgi:pantothenate synthetase
MKYRIDARYVWYNRGTEIVLMYFINQIPFTFDDLPKTAMQDLELIHLADSERRFEPEDLYQASFYLMLEECHPLMFELELENPEMLPVD